MIVYRDQQRIVSTAGALAVIRCRSLCGHAALRDVLIEFGQFECGIADALPPRNPALAELRRIAVLLGRIFYRGGRAGEFTVALDRLSRAELPENIALRTPEGYAYYALFPESYVAAAEKFWREMHPREATVIGIRSIGASLSAVVAGALAERGVGVETFTIRPTGHPFNRVAELPASRTGAGPHLIVDEGPGLSGSSFASVAEALSRAGVPDSHTVFFPSWRPDVSALVSEKARQRWNRHRSFVESFHPAIPAVWIEVSGGRWRELLFAREPEYPAVQPQHERRKFLRPTGPHIIAKFAGLGPRGRGCFDRAKKLHRAGFVPAPLKYDDGFLFSSFVPGRPVTEISTGLVCAAAKYLAYLFRESASPDPPATAELLHMVTANVSEVRGKPWTPPPEWIAPLRDSRAWHLDGRMLRHEWIETPSGFLKTDAVDHGDDHFFPGPQDIAWDVAAAAVEFSLDDPAVLLDRYASLSGDRTIHRRFPFYALAYSAFRYGYCQLALLSVHGAERRRFVEASLRYLDPINRYGGPQLG